MEKGEEEKIDIVGAILFKNAIQNCIGKDVRNAA